MTSVRLAASYPDTMSWAEAALQRYQRQMGALEMPEWEQTVERRSARSYGGVPRKSTKPAIGLIDLDLVRGSTFPKAKPHLGMWYAVRHGLLRAALLPIYRRWWRRHVGPRLFLALLAAYLLYAALLVVLWVGDPASAPRRAADRRASRAKLVRIAALPETVRCYHTDSTDSKSGDEFAELSPSSSTSALSKAAPSAAGGPLLDPDPFSCRPGTDSSVADASCSERHQSDADSQPHRSYVKTSGSDSEASYSSGGSATSGQRSAAATGSFDNPLLTPSASSDRTGCTIWEGVDVKKVDLTTLDICSVVVNRVESMPQSTDYLVFGLAMAALISLLPTLCRLGGASAPLVVPGWRASLCPAAVLNVSLEVSHHLATLSDAAFGVTGQERMVTVGCLLVTLLVTGLLFFLLSVVERSFKQRLLYAKYFCYLTSARRARKFELPHFRLKKVRNIKTWLSVRSCLKKRGPQRSIDTIVSSACLTTVVLVTCLCVELLENTDSPRIDYYRTQLVVWCFSLGVYLVRVMSLGSYINRKYRNLSVVLTEQINLYLQIEQKPHKKERLVLANNVLKLACDLLKELESPFTVLGFSANPFLYNATKVIVLSACSGVLSDMLGFKLKLYKIKLK
ncbi:putative homeodomain transcription factor [Pollicipes pollicipes]|uniref:putative homeodomain transcription factor n=1 Tax=Pollicipes pollicipes TaxID=41117 RepID=UPI001885793F|nr:putative homeodomain transcription factor [Pollicipes pollicipes]